MMKGHVHPLVYLVGHDIGVGSAGYKKLLGWLADMEIDITRVRLYDHTEKPFDGGFTRQSLVQAINLDQIRVIGVGRDAKKYLTSLKLPKVFILASTKGARAVKNKLTQGKDFVYGKEETEAEDSSEASAE